MTTGEVDLTSEVATAGAYVLFEHQLAFVVGPTTLGDRPGVVRLGGHREGEETAWECTGREVQDALSLEIYPLVSPATCWLGTPHRPAAVRAAPRATGPNKEATAILVTWRPEKGWRRLSVMFLATAQGIPEPSGEVAGLLLLRRLDILTLAGGMITLAEFLRAGGQAILRTPLPTDVPLQPFLQLLVLAELLRRDLDFLPNLW